MRHLMRMFVPGLLTASALALGTVRAAPEVPPPPPPPPPPATPAPVVPPARPADVPPPVKEFVKTPAVQGTLVRVLGAEKQFVLRTGDGKEMLMSVVPNARIQLNKQPATLADLPAGMVVTVLYTTNGDRFIASAIEAPAAVVVDPAVPVVTGGTVRGVVMEGDRPQPKLQVFLVSVNGKAVANQLTQLDGTFVFENVAPGEYRLTAAKTASQTVGESPVTVEASKTKGVTINLLRP